MVTKFSRSHDKSQLPYLGHRERLRKRFDQHGDKGLADYELLELFLFLVLPRADVKPIAKELLSQFGSLLAVFSANPASLKGVKGVGNAVSHALSLIHSILSRVLRHEIQGKMVLKSWQQVIDYCIVAMSFKDIEELRVLFLDQKNQLILDEVQQTGTINHIVIYPREVIKRALEVGAAALILVHNHPSGDPTPSTADIELTRKIKDAGEIFGITVHDHIIIGQGRQMSFKAMGIL